MYQNDFAEAFFPTIIKTSYRHILNLPVMGLLEIENNE